MNRPALVLLLTSLTIAARAAEVPAQPVGFRDQVAPILVKKCLGCHNDKKSAGGLNMSTFAGLRKGGEKGGDLILEPGAPDDSLLIELIRPGAAPRMPYKLAPLKKEEIQVLERWVKQGARFDGPSETETPIASLVDPLRDLPRVALKAPASDPVTSVAFTPDGKTLAAAAGRNVLLFDAVSGKPRATLGDHPGPLTSVRITPDGKTLVASGGRPGLFGSVIVWDLETRSRRFDLRGHRDAILAAEIAPDGKTLATAGYDRLILLWDLETGTTIRTLKDHTDAVYAVAFAPDGLRLASAGADRTAKLWDVASGRRLRTLSDATAELYAVAFGPDGRTILAGGVDRSIRAWRVDDQEAALVQSVFAHDAAILRLLVSPDGKTLLSSGEDRDVKLWDLSTLKARTALNEQPDWPQGVAISPDGARVAVGRYDGSLAIVDVATGKELLALRTAPATATPAKPQLLRNASLNPPSPRGAARGSKVRVTVSGTGAGQATAVILPEPGLAATILPAAKTDPNRLEIELSVAPEASAGLHRIGLVTPLGVPPFKTFAVSSHPEAAEAEPNDEPIKARMVALPATFLGTIDRPGDVDHFRFEVKAGQVIVFETVARSMGSTLLPVLTLLDDQGRTLAESSDSEPGLDPVLTFTAPQDGRVTLRVADADYSGSGNHFYRVSAGMDPLLSSVFPLGVEPGQTATIQVSGANLEDIASVSLPVSRDAEPGTMLAIPVALPGGARPDGRRTVIVAEGPQKVEAEPNDEPTRAGPITAPGGVSGRIDREGDADCFRFDARKGERWIVEVFGRRLGTAIDPVVEILDANGRPVPRAVLRPVTQTEVAFRDHDATKTGIRLVQWNNLAIDDLVLIGREVARIEALPRNPDDDCQFWSEQNQRLAFLETTTEHHPMGQAVAKVEVHPPGTVFPPGGAPAVVLNYRNDDGGPGFMKDARLTFDAPADGSYIVRVEDVRGLGVERSGYHLVVRRPRPDFRLALSSENPNVPRGGTTLVTVNLSRVDGFDGPVDLQVEGLPAGLTATASRIEAGALSAIVALSADATAPAFSLPTWKVIARASSGRTIEHTLDPGGPEGGWITVTPSANLAIAAEPRCVEIHPGQQVAMRLTVTRGPAFAGRVPIDVRNLPRGVRVLNVGLNGVLVTEAQTERTIFLYAEPWAEPVERPFYAVGKAESAGTEHSAPPIGLVVRPGSVGRPATAVVVPR
jgi:hypothetical protein